jgi:hypothetical protein
MCSMERLRARVGEPLYGETHIQELHEQGTVAWKRAATRFYDASYHAKSSDYERLRVVRDIFLMMEMKIEKGSDTFSHRYRLAKGLSLMANIFDEMIEVRTSICSCRPSAEPCVAHPRQS